MEDRSSSPELFESPESSCRTDTPKENDIHLTGGGPEWRGSPMSELLLDNNPWKHHCASLIPSRHHTVLFEVPVPAGCNPRPHYSSSTCHWNSSHVRMPFSPSNLYPVKEGQEETLKSRWELIQSVLLRPIQSSGQLQEAIFSYNLRHARFEALHHLLREVLDEDESQHFFNVLLPQVVQLALQLPELLATPLPLLRQGRAHSVSLSQLQIASLLANAFLCTFPWRRDMASYPGVNFNHLFECKSAGAPYIAEKLKCVLHYFRRVCTRSPTGVITFERKQVARSRLPRWDRLQAALGTTRLHVTSAGTIEDGGLGLLQVDFANCMVGGGVLGRGCVQEEIRFLVCPELIAARLFSEQLAPTEALQVTGVERFSRYCGYADSFQWAGDYEDETPFDASGRRRTTIVAIDALYYSKRSAQFSPSKMIRELNKAYVGFHEELSGEAGGCLSAVATGNWGCGAFRGNAHLKALLQLMACTAARRDIVYYTFGDSQLRDVLFRMYQFLAQHKVTVSQLWRYLCRFNEAQLHSKHLFSYIQQAHLDSLKSSCGQQSVVTAETKQAAGTEAACKSMDVDVREEQQPQLQQVQSVSSRTTSQIQNNYVNSTSAFRSKIKRNEDSCKKNHKEIKKFLYSSDEEDQTSVTQDLQSPGLLFAADSFLKNQRQEVAVTNCIDLSQEASCENMDICHSQDDERTSNFTTPQKLNITKSKEKPLSNKKISDYFKVVPK